MFDFIKKASFLTFCIGALIYFVFPKYEMIDKERRLNKISGKIEKFDDRYPFRDWYQCK